MATRDEHVDPAAAQPGSLVPPVEGAVLTWFVGPSSESSLVEGAGAIPVVSVREIGGVGVAPAVDETREVPWVAPGVEIERLPLPTLVDLEDAHRALSSIHDLGVAGLSAVETRDALVQAQQLVARASATVSVLAAHASAIGAGDVNGSPNAAVWLANATKLTRREAHRVVRVGDAVTDSDGSGTKGRYASALGPAFRDGRVGVEQAEVIVRSLDALPDTLDPELVRRAEAWLVDAARDFDAQDLRGLGKKILSVVAPEVGDAVDAAALEREEREANGSARFTMTADGEGRVRGRFTLPEVQGAMLRKALEGYASPGHKNADADPESRFQTGIPSPARMGEAFVELIEGLAERDLPDVGGTGATVVVTMGLDALLGGLATANLDTGELISAAQARRLACEAQIVPVVLNGKSEVLDVGRAQRFHTKAQRRAIAARDRGCTAEGCDRAPHQCHVHHDSPWSSGGRTDVRTGRLLCGHHHRRAHDPRYAVERLGTGKLRFTRRE